MEEKEIEKKETKKRKKGSNKVLTTILIVILLVAFLGIGFAIGSAQLLKEFTKQTGIDPTETEKTTIENLSVYDERITGALKGFEQIGFVPEEAYTTSITDIDKKGLIVTALKGLENEQINFCVNNETGLTKPITIDDLNKSLKKAIPDGKITEDDIANNANETTSYSIGGYGYSFKFMGGTKEEYSIKIIDNKIYVVGPCGHEGPNETTIVSETEKAELNGDILNIYQKVAFGKTEYEANESGIIYEYYKDKEYKTKEETISVNDQPNMSLYNTYKLTFKKNGDKYYFESSKLQ